MGTEAAAAAQAGDDEPRRFVPMWDRDGQPNISGRISSIGEAKTRFGIKGTADVELGDGRVVRVLVANVRLVEKFDALGLTVGNGVEIAFLGKKRIGEQPEYYDYDVKKLY